MAERLVGRADGREQRHRRCDQAPEDLQKMAESNKAFADYRW